jgi:hypothetical protein
MHVTLPSLVFFKKLNTAEAAYIFLTTMLSNLLQQLVII